MPDHDPIISIGFLSQRDLDMLGVGFKRHFPMPDDSAFDDLIAKLDTISIDGSPPPVVAKLTTGR